MSNGKEKAYNMTPNVSEEEAKQVRDKFDATYMKGRGKVNTEGLIMDIPKPEMLGSSGIFGILGGGVGQLVKGAGNIISRSPIFSKIVKSFANTPKQYLNLSKPKPTGNFKELVTGNKVYDTKMVNDAFKQRFGSPKPSSTSANAANPTNVIKNHVAKKPEKDALTHPYFNKLRK